jgi:hypothetical protein
MGRAGDGDGTGVDASVDLTTARTTGTASGATEAAVWLGISTVCASAAVPTAGESASRAGGSVGTSADGKAAGGFDGASEEIRRGPRELPGSKSDPAERLDAALPGFAAGRPPDTDEAFAEPVASALDDGDVSGPAVSAWATPVATADPSPTMPAAANPAMS